MSRPASSAAVVTVVVAVALLSAAGRVFSGGGAMTTLSEWFAYRHANECLTRELTRQSVAILRERQANVSRLGVDTVAWKQRQADVRDRLAQVFAPLPPRDRAPPNVTVVATLQKDGFELRRLLIESRPGFFISAVLYVPSGLVARRRRGEAATAPGILFLSGHTQNAFRADHTSDDDYQIVQLNLVARGFVLLSIDPIGQGERYQYFAPGLNSSCTAEHEYLGRQLILNGVGAMSLWLWDEMLSVDYLSSLPMVASDALGSVGCSGGGTQSSYIAAMDPRIKAASIACYMSTFEIDRMWIEAGRSDGEQSWPHGIALGLDKPDLLEARAPLPTQVLITTDDTCFPAQGGRDAVAEASSAFEALGDRQALQSHEAIWHHGWVQPNREQIYAFFCQHLGNITSAPCSSSSELPIPELTAAELTVTSTGQVNTAPEVRSVSVHDIIANLTANHTRELEQRRVAGPEAFLATVRATAPVLAGYRPWPQAQPGRVVFAGSEFDTNPQVATKAKWVLSQEGECLNALVVYTPANATGPFPAVVIYTKKAGEAVDEDLGKVILGVVGAGYLVALPDLCGFGEVGDAFPRGYDDQPGTDMAHEIGRSVPGLHAGDMVRTAGYLLARSDVKSIAATLSFNQTHPALLLANLAANASSFGKLFLAQPLATWASCAMSEYYDNGAYYSWMFGALRHFDLPDLVAALAPRDVFVASPVAPDLATTLSPAESAAAYNFSRATYAAHQAANRFQVANLPPDQLLPTILPWLAAPRV